MLLFYRSQKLENFQPEPSDDVYAKCKRLVGTEETHRKQQVEDCLATLQNRIAVEERHRTQVRYAARAAIPPPVPSERAVQVLRICQD